MNLDNWVDTEIKKACKRENPNWDGESFDYGCSCYKNAGDAAKAAFAELVKEGHSGFSWNMTIGILKRLIDQKPLTPITEEDFEGVEPYDSYDGAQCYQCPRYTSLFMHKYKDGKVELVDVDRAVCFDINEPRDRWGGGMSQIVDEMFPVTFPYSPANDYYKVAVEEVLYDKALGDYDMYKIHYIEKPNGDKVEVNKCLKEEIDHWVKYEDSDYMRVASTGFKEITEEQFQDFKSREQIETKYKEGDPLVIESGLKCSCGEQCECCDCAG